MVLRASQLYTNRPKEGRDDFLSRSFSAFDSYADSLLAVMEFVFLGLMVSYTVNMLRERALDIRLDLEILREEYADLKVINEENVLIKNEYEERLLTSKSGFPKLYGLVSRLMVQEPDRILMETMQVISELVRTDTVAGEGPAALDEIGERDLVIFCGGSISPYADPAELEAFIAGGGRVIFAAGLGAGDELCRRVYGYSAQGFIRDVVWPAFQGISLRTDTPYTASMLAAASSEALYTGQQLQTKTKFFSGGA